MASVIRFVFWLLAPFALVFGGAALTGWGLSNEWTFVVYAGGIITLVGLLWGLWLILVNSGGGDFF